MKKVCQIAAYGPAKQKIAADAEESQFADGGPFFGRVTHAW